MIEQVCAARSRTRSFRGFAADLLQGCIRFRPGRRAVGGVCQSLSPSEPGSQRPRRPPHPRIAQRGRVPVSRALQTGYYQLPSRCSDCVVELSQHAEELPYIRDEQLWHLQRREVAASGKVGSMHDVVALFAKASNGNVLGKGSYTHRDRRRRPTPIGSTVHIFVVQPRR